MPKFLRTDAVERKEKRFITPFDGNFNIERQGELADNVQPEIGVEKGRGFVGSDGVGKNDSPFIRIKKNRNSRIFRCMVDAVFQNGQNQFCQGVLMGREKKRAPFLNIHRLLFALQQRGSIGGCIGNQRFHIDENGGFVLRYMALLDDEKLF